MKLRQAILNKRSAQLGMTLIEIMVVIVILGLLLGVVGVAVINQVDKARVKTAQMQISALGQALDSYKLDNGHYPATEQGLDALINQPSVGRLPKNWAEGGYLKKREVPLDPWGNAYQFLGPGINNTTSFDVWSLGPDAEDGSDDEINNWGGGAREE